jgi:tetratricopeptide (TPR) repeat protein
MAMGRFDEAVASGLDYLSRYTNAPERPEVQFHLANALKQLGRDNEALHQVLTLLSEQRARANERPEVWAYWQQRTGNVVANQLYREGDFTKALDIYTSLAGLDTSPQWQLPVSYQIGMTYERLMQPQKATDTYADILNREKQYLTNMPPSLKAVFDMARWRIKFIEWQEKAEAANRSLRPPAAPAEAPPVTPLASLPKPSPALP